MKPLKFRLTEMSQQLNTPLYVIEKDYLLSHLLANIAQQPVLSNVVIFKGGTALKKMYFGKYRFSEDLDFSTVNAPDSEVFTQLLNDVIQNTQQSLHAYGQFKLNIKKKAERSPHPFGQQAFIINAQFPWHSSPQCNVKFEFTHDEPILLKPILLPIIHEYEDPIDAKLFCYTLEEIIAEKMRALLQTHRNLIERGWNRPRARDYYDLWHLLTSYEQQINVELLSNILKPKCAHRQVSYQSIDDFFTDKLIQEAKQHWQSNLGNFVIGLPNCEDILQQTRTLLLKVLPELREPA
ncbi:MAG: nucleotidyl transferase AbiEii/AbiGii toxin family protein [Gammaproteobacteria bacterium]